MADRWFASSQIHHGHTTADGTACRLVGRGRIDKKLVSPHTGDVVDRDHNAALNLRDWPDYASCGPVGTTAPRYPGQPYRLVQAMAPTPDQPAPVELPQVHTPAWPEAVRPEPKPRKGKPPERVTKTHSTATV